MPDFGNNESDSNQKMSRRTLLRKGFGLGLIGASGALGIDLVAAKGPADGITQESSVPLHSNPEIHSVQPVQSKHYTKPNSAIEYPRLYPEVKSLDSETKKELNTILQLPLKSKERLKAETEYVVKADGNLDAINRGFWVVVDSDLRCELLEMRYKLRTLKKTRLQPISSQKEQWALQHNIHPEVLATAIDNYENAIKLIGELRSDLRPDLPETVDPFQLAMNPGGIAELICRETGIGYRKLGPRYGFGNIGSVPAIEQYNPAKYPNGKEDLKKYCKMLSNATGLNYVPENIPGDIWLYNHDPRYSGGGIGSAGQFMPNNAIELFQMAAKKGKILNLFDIESGLLAVWMFLAHREVFPGIGERVGFRNNDPAVIEKAIEKWNGNPDEVSTIFRDTTEYEDQFQRFRKAKIMDAVQ